MLAELLFVGGWDDVSAHPTGLLIVCGIGAALGFVCGIVGADYASYSKVPVRRRIAIGAACGARLSAWSIVVGLIIMVYLAFLLEAANTNAPRGAEIVFRRLGNLPPLLLGAIGGALFLCAYGAVQGLVLALIFRPVMRLYGLTAIGACTMPYMFSGVLLWEWPSEMLLSAKVMVVLLLVVFCLLGGAIGYTVSKRLLLLSNPPAKIGFR
ncbi:MAG: hypothetical protein ACYTEZ_13100 [Planctomycetota bacterium]|jgi:ABC-type polysaccharide/polyol phosphate export permease